MSSRQEREDFIENTIPSDLLDQAVEWVSRNMTPDQVFDDEALTQWARENDMLPPLFVYWLNTGNNYRAVVIAEGSNEARHVAQTHEPSGRWHTASATKIAECRASRTRQVLAMERL